MYHQQRTAVKYSWCSVLDVNFRDLKWVFLRKPLLAKYTPRGEGVLCVLPHAIAHLVLYHNRINCKPWGVASIKHFHTKSQNLPIGARKPWALVSTSVKSVSFIWPCRILWGLKFLASYSVLHKISINAILIINIFKFLKFHVTWLK